MLWWSIRDSVFIMLYICSWKTGEHLHVLIAVSIMVGCCGWGGTGVASKLMQDISSILLGSVCKLVFQVQVSSSMILSPPLSPLSSSAGASKFCGARIATAR